MTEQVIAVETADFNGIKLRYVKGLDPLFIVNDVAAALGYTSREGLMFRIPKPDIESFRLERRTMSAIRRSRLCELLAVTYEQRPEQSKMLRDFIIRNILSAQPDAVNRSEPRKRQEKPLVGQFGGDIVGWRNGSLVTTSAVIAGVIKYHHRDVMDWVFDCLVKIEQFGKVEFDEEPFVAGDGIEQRQIAIFNEKQAAVLLTCMHKEQCKKYLSRAFYEKSQKGAPNVRPAHPQAIDLLWRGDIPIPAAADILEPASKRSFDASRVTPVLSSPTPVAPALAVGAVEPVISSGNVLTMSSREIAELTGKDHKNVMADIRKMLRELGKAAADFSATAFIDGPNNSKREVEIFNLPEREIHILVSGYSITMRARIIDRWQKLERQATGVAGQHQFAIPKTLHEALQLAANLAKDKEVVIEKLAVSDAKLAITEPKAEALDVIANTEGLYGLQEAGKALGQPPIKFVKWLRDEVGGWIYKRSHLSKNMPFVDKERDGSLVVKSVPRLDRNGVERMEPQTMVTPKGLTRIALLLKEIPPSYTVNKTTSAPKPRGLVRQAISKALKPVVPYIFEEMQAGQQEPLF